MEITFWEISENMKNPFAHSPTETPSFSHKSAVLSSSYCVEIFPRKTAQDDLQRKIPG